MAESPEEAGARQHDGLSWTWELDLEALLAAVAGPGATESTPALDQADTDQADTELAEYLEALEAGRSEVVPLPVIAGRIAESVPVGPELAGWLGTGHVAGLEDRVLAGMASSYRRLASWAQAGELSVVAELASRSAAADDRIGTDEHGRPAKVPADTCAEVSLALTMSQTAASWWADLAVTLRWRLAATGAALAAGTIDLTRARAIADATTHLNDQTAQTVQDRVLPKAGAQTTAQLRAALRRAVIAADPEGADRRREEAEKQAKIMLYPDAEGTTSLGGYSLPGIPATAAMARITALARAMQASGAGGGIDLLRAHVFLGLLLGTLPYIPPPADAPPDQPPPDQSPDDDDGPRGGGSPDRSQPDNESHDGVPQHSNPPADYRSRNRDRRGALGNDADDGAWIRPPPAWPKVPAFLQPGPAAMNHLTPATGAGGLLDLSLPWDTLTDHSPQPGKLGRLGSITPTQARRIADLAAVNPATLLAGHPYRLRRTRHRHHQARRPRYQSPSRADQAGHRHYRRGQPDEESGGG